MHAVDEDGGSVTVSQGIWLLFAKTVKITLLVISTIATDLILDPAKDFVGEQKPKRKYPSKTRNQG